jgi:hypothetical protein
MSVQFRKTKETQGINEKRNEIRKFMFSTNKLESWVCKAFLPTGIHCLQKHFPLFPSDSQGVTTLLLL